MKLTGFQFLQNLKSYEKLVPDLSVFIITKACNKIWKIKEK